jgi:hypothetical protein
MKRVNSRLSEATEGGSHPNQLHLREVLERSVDHDFGQR